jgi:uncharacterized protein
VPINIHPGVPPPSMLAAYYDGFSPELSQIFATSGWGWHPERAVHVLRMVLAGTFDVRPRLKVIIGHMVESLRTMLDYLRLAGRQGKDRPRQRRPGLL